MQKKQRKLYPISACQTPSYEKGLVTCTVDFEKYFSRQ